MSRTALLAGATGLVGRHLLRRLLAMDEYREVRVLSRRPLDHEQGKLSLRLTDFEDLREHAEFLAVDHVYIALGTTLRKAGSRAAFERVDYHMVVDLARAARLSGARRLAMVSAAGSSERSPSFYSRVKARAERAVSELDYEAVHLLRPSLLLGERGEWRPAERLGQLISPLLSLLLVGPLSIWRPVRAEDVAEAMIRRMNDDAAVGVHVHHLPLKDA